MFRLPHAAMVHEYIESELLRFRPIGSILARWGAAVRVSTLNRGFGGAGAWGGHAGNGGRGYVFDAEVLGG